jgi:HPt (histidine-containing phosphotransfer) domain-containing protein
MQKNVCNLGYLIEMMEGKKHLIKGIMDAFLLQIPEELGWINAAVGRTDYPIIKNLAHTMKSSVSIMGISILTPILKEMEELGVRAAGIEKIKELNQSLNSICELAIEEIKKEKLNYV